MHTRLSQIINVLKSQMRVLPSTVDSVAEVVELSSGFVDRTPGGMGALPPDSGPLHESSLGLEQSGQLKTVSWLSGMDRDKVNGTTATETHNTAGLS